MSAIDDRYTQLTGRLHLTGIQALARLPLDIRRSDARAGRRTAGFISGYEGSPLAGYDTELTRNLGLLTEHDVVFRPGVNEELAATAVQGSQLAAMQDDKRVDGVFGIWYGKSPGLDRATDAIRHSNLMGTHPEGGALALVGEDPGAKSSTVPGASELLLADLSIPTLYPADPQEVLDLGQHGIALSRTCGLWVALKIATNVADGSGTVDLDPDRVRPQTPDPVEGEPYRHQVSAQVIQPNLTEMERSREGVRLELARRYAATNNLNRVSHKTPGDTIGIIAAGKTFRDVQQALAILGLDEAMLQRSGIRLLKLGLVYPLEPTVTLDFASGLQEIIIVEEKKSFIESAVRDLLYGTEGAPRVVGKRLPAGEAFIPAHGELDPDFLAERLAHWLTQIGDFPSTEAWLARPVANGRIPLPLVLRTPYFCSGCPHNISTKTPAGATVGAGIGCHAMVALMDERQVGNVIGMTQMGGEGAQWIGMSPFLKRNHLFQNLGDGTFHHSGSLAIRAAVASGVDITYKLLYNSAVAMTGGQQAIGLMTVPQICAELTAEGASRILITADDPRRYRKTKLPKGVQVWSRDRIIEAQELLATIGGVTVLIHDQECATELRRKRKRKTVEEPVQRVMINERVCEGCGDCGQKSNCLSVQPIDTEFGRKTQIDQSSCNKDYSCLAGDCPSFITVTPGTQGKGPKDTGVLSLAHLPEAPVATSASSHTTRIAGVGGAGVVTLAQVLSTAASLAGLHVRALDQTGLAQKWGAVVSDIKICSTPMEQAHKVAAGECDLYLGCDLLVAADPRYLSAADPNRTTAIVSTSQVPTGQMVVDTSLHYPDVTPIRRLLADRSKHAVFLDARAASLALFSDDLYANMLLTGAASQSGALPIPASTIEDAIILNGVKAQANLSAFRHGRLMIADPKRYAAALSAASSSAEELYEGETELSRLLRLRIPELVAYQSIRYANEYSQYVHQVQQAESDRAPGHTELTEAVARYLYKLMAYKDEYEVARLSLDPALQAQAEATFGPGARIAYRLHPPALRSMGMKNKIELGGPFRIAFRALRSMRRLRGTALDPFGYAHLRRVERDLITEYRNMIDSALSGLNSENHSLAVEIAALPDMVRGYESIKLGNIDSYRARAKELLARYRGAEAVQTGG